MISIVVPVYNVEKYLRRCLDSILAQTFIDYECILVDDASPDNCPAICDEYAAKDKRFRVIHKKQNEGLPAARKSGQKLISAEFLMHVDSDDWLEPNALEILYNKQRETNADMVIGSFREYFIDKTRNIVFIDSIISNKQKILTNFFSKRFKYIWGKLYRTQVFEHIMQPSNLIYAEDMVVNVQILCSDLCNTIAVIKDIVYNYDCSTGGISQGLLCTPGKAVNFFESLVFVRNYLKQNQYFNFCIKGYFYRFIFAVLYVKLFYNVPKHDVLKLLRSAKFPYIYFPINIKSLAFNIMNCLFFINQNLYKTIIDKYSKFRQRNV
ncbi:MAG: glycosyltransferase [Treponema sp.]|jgi:glycosyltransferase involved in cell wall biosynthesis|nr:glycosyltransferase [Treponema sp.]